MNERVNNVVRDFEKLILESRTVQLDSIIDGIFDYLVYNYSKKEIQQEYSYFAKKIGLAEWIIVNDFEKRYKIIKK